MVLPSLSTARIHARVDFAPKSLLYYAHRAVVANMLYPVPYPNWEINPTVLSLVDPVKRRRLQFLAGVIGFVMEGSPTTTDALPEHFGEVARHFRDVCNPDGNIARIGWRRIYVTEHTSFDELFPAFRSNTLRHEKSWIQLGDYSIRDLGFTAVYYGTEQDGLNLRIGILTSDQATELLKSEEYLKAPPAPLAIDQGCLMIDLDRYKKAYQADISKFFANADREIERFAHDLASRVTRS